MQLRMQSRETVALDALIRRRCIPQAIIVLLLLIALCITCTASAAGGACIKGPPEPKSPIIPKMRAIQTVQCSYDFQQFTSRLLALATDKSSLDTVETLKQVFAIPDMITGYNHPRIAAYALDMSGQGDWNVRLSASEAFFPLQQGPAKFVPGPHPRRLDKPANASLQIEVSVVPLRSATKVGAQCVPILALRDAFKKSGWNDNAEYVKNNADNALSFAYQNKSVLISADCSKRTPQRITLSQKPGKPG